MTINDPGREEMESRKEILRQTLGLFLGLAVCSAVTVGVFALLGYYDYTVLLGVLAGSLVALGNFLFMAIGVALAADRAAKQDVKAGKSLITSSYLVRTLVMFVILFACAKSGHFHVIALVLPLVFVRPVLTVAEFFQKKGA